MRLILLLLLASAFGYGVLQIDKIDPDNYVKIYLGHYVVEIKVLGFLLLLIAVVLVLYFLFWLFRLLWRSPRSFANWRGRRNHDKAEQQLGAGYLSLIKGDWRKAENQLLSKSSHSGVPYVNYLAAAQAAQEQGRLEQRDEYLKSAHDVAPNERFAIGLTKAKLHQRAGQMDMALATLQDISEQGRKNPQYTAMLLQTHEQMNNWQGAQNLLPIAKKQGALPDNVLSGIQDKIYRNSLNNADDIEAVWRSLPREQRLQVGNIEIYAKALAAKGDVGAAEKLIRSALKNTWSDELVRIYGNLSASKPSKLLRRVEGWLMARPENAELNLAAGHLAMADKKFDEAKTYLQTAISLAQLPQAYALLGEIFESSNDSGQALKLYRAGVQSLTQHTHSHPVDSPIEQTQMASLEGRNETPLADKQSVKEGELVGSPTEH